jgi:hypothetical protein
MVIDIFADATADSGREHLSTFTVKGITEVAENPIS